jgi:23S rRNA pseudouridine2605 synthase
MRLNKFLAHCGVGSRRKVENFISAGRIQINGEIIRELGTQVQEGMQVTFDGTLVNIPESLRTIVFHKPIECLCTASDPQGRQLIYDFLPPEYKHFRYVGRLDFSSRGLLLMTEDGELARRLTLPDYAVERQYHVQLNRELGPKSLRKMEAGVEIEGGHISRPQKIKSQGKSADIVLCEGKKREVRLMMRALGYRVQDLLRVRYGPITLDGVSEGGFRELIPDELDVIYEMVQ